MIERGGKQFVLFAGLLDEAHKRGLSSIETQLVQIPTQENGMVAICKAWVEVNEIDPATGLAVTDTDGVAATIKTTGIGDASPENVGRNIVPHIIRMAETRAKARALRDAVNVGATSLEELSDSDGDQPAPPPRSSTGSRKGGKVSRPRPVPAEGELPSQESGESNVAEAMANAAQIKAIYTLAGELGGGESTEILKWIEDEYSNAPEMLTDSEAGNVIQRLNKRKAALRGQGKG